MKRFKEAVTDKHFLTNLPNPRYKGKTFVWSWWSCRTAAPKASSRASRSYCRFVWFHRRLRSISGFTSITRMYWPNVVCSVMDVCFKLQMPSVTTPDKHCTENTSSAVEFRCNWTSVFQLRSHAKQTTKSAWLGKGSKTCNMLQTAAWKCWTRLETEINTRQEHSEIFRH